MRYMNDYDIARARSIYTRASKPNRLALAIVVERLAEWTNTVSDGWAYWPKPCRAAAKAMALIDPITNAEEDHFCDVDATDAEVKAAVAPIKAFLTRAARERHGLYPGRPMVTADERELILRAVS